MLYLWTGAILATGVVAQPIEVFVWFLVDLKVIVSDELVCI